MVDGNRVSEDMRAVAEDGDNQAVGGSELGAECRAATPAETRSRARAEITARPRRGAMLGHQGVLVDEDCILGLDPRDAVAGPGHVDRTQARYSCACSLPSGDERLSLRRDAPSVFGNGWLGDVSIERGAELGQCGGSHAGHRDMQGKPRIGYRENSGSTPIWITLQSCPGASRLGIHGTSHSRTRITSASSR